MTTIKGIRGPRNGGLVSAAGRSMITVSTAIRVLMRPPRVSKQHMRPLSLRMFIFGAGATCAVLLCSMIFIDAAASHTARGLPRWVILFFNTITDFGKSGYFLWPLGILFLVLATLPPMLNRFSQRVMAALMVRVGFLFLAIGLPGLFVTTIKRMIGRARPFVGGHLDPFLFKPFIWRVEYAGMPSGHTTTAFSVLVALGTLWPRGRPVLLIYAFLIAMSRVVVTAHYPSDVLAGALVGTIGALMVRRWFALKHLGFSIGPDGALVQYAGPSFRRIKAVARDLLAE
jgi:membrane-associated phospholipid phosphatase